MKPNIDTKLIDQFLTDQETDFIDQFILKNGHKDPSWVNDKIFSGDYYLFDFYNPAFKPVYDILWPKLKKVFGEKLYMQQIHIFDCVNPYDIHSDIRSGGPMKPEAPHYAWTLIIPMSTVNSHTIVFDQGNTEKNLGEHCKDIPPMEKPSIDEATYKKYFTHVDYGVFHWLTVEKIFKWKKGSLFASDRFKFHCSDNFLANGEKKKRAIVAWTSMRD